MAFLLGRVERFTHEGALVPFPYSTAMGRPPLKMRRCDVTLRERAVYYCVAEQRQR